MLNACFCWVRLVSPQTVMLYAKRTDFRLFAYPIVVSLGVRRKPYCCAVSLCRDREATGNKGLDMKVVRQIHLKQVLIHLYGKIFLKISPQSHKE